MHRAEDDASTLRRHITRTYLSLRIGIGVIGIALPILLWLGGRIFDHEPLRESMSAYYYSVAMRDSFVGLLVTIGVVLYLYKGFSTAENWILNVAGALAVGIAMVPTADAVNGGGYPALHKSIAVAFFVAIASVCIFLAPDTLSLIRDTRVAERYRLVYQALGAGMIVMPALAVVLAYRTHSRTFFLEATAVWMFGAYWLVKSHELEQTDAEQLAIDGKLQRAPKTATKQAPGTLVQIAP